MKAHNIFKQHDVALQPFDTKFDDKKTLKGLRYNIL